SRSWRCSSRSTRRGSATRKSPMPDPDRTLKPESDTVSSASPNSASKFGGVGAVAPLPTRLTELFGIRYPVVQTGMGWVATPQLAAATSAAGGLGILAAATMSLDELRRAVKEVRERTDAPFGVNMRADQADIVERVDVLV